MSEAEAATDDMPAVEVGSTTAARSFATGTG